MWLDNLKKMKELSGMTTKEIAARSSIPEPTLEKIFAGSTKDPKLETVRQLVHFLGFSLDDLEGNLPETQKKPTLETEDGLDAEIIRLFSELSDAKKQEALNYLRYLSAQPENP